MPPQLLMPPQLQQLLLLLLLSLHPLAAGQPQVHQQQQAC
jgi:hypothetical protein